MGVKDSSLSQSGLDVYGCIHWRWSTIHVGWSRLIQQRCWLWPSVWFTWNAHHLCELELFCSHSLQDTGGLDPTRGVWGRSVGESKLSKRGKGEQHRWAAESSRSGRSGPSWCCAQEMTHIHTPPTDWRQALEHHSLSLSVFLSHTESSWVMDCQSCMLMMWKTQLKHSADFAKKLEVT